MGRLDCLRARQLCPCLLCSLTGQAQWVSAPNGAGDHALQPTVTAVLIPCYRSTCGVEASTALCAPVLEHAHGLAASRSGSVPWLAGRVLLLGSYLAPVLFTGLIGGAHWTAWGAWQLETGGTS
jgi:hypothetical protein